MPAATAAQPNAFEKRTNGGDRRGFPCQAPVAKDVREKLGGITGITLKAGFPVVGRTAVVVFQSASDSSRCRKPVALALTRSRAQLISASTKT